MPVPGVDHEPCSTTPSGMCHWEIAYAMLRSHVTDPRMAACPGVHIKAGATVIEALLSEDLQTDLRTLQRILAEQAARWQETKTAQDEGSSATG
jgi:hypothetical protein